MEKKSSLFLKFIYVLIAFNLLLSVFFVCLGLKKNNEDKELLSLSNYKLPEVIPESLNKEFKVLVIELDPILTKGTIEGRKCSGKSASECLGQNKSTAVNELITDLKESSNNNVSVKIVKTEKINEFPTYKNKVTLLNGKTDYRFDEDTWVDIMKNGWYSGINDSRITGDWFGSYDYEYIINKLDLIKRRNNNEFDEVWIVNVDPAGTYESIMVGTNAFWINGTPIEKDCKPFKMINVSISRPDVNFECFGHATEQLLSNVFKNTYWSGYDPLNWKDNSTTITKTDYEKLNLFQKFMLTENQNTNKNSGYVGVGNIHYSPNSTSDYDWNNLNLNVYSKYNEWKNYPNITNNPSSIVFSPNIYTSKKINGTNSDARLHHRWWFSLLPNHNGYTIDGYYNNWWKYYMSNTYVESITSPQLEYNYHIKDKLDNITFTLKYRNGSTEKVNLKYDNNIEINNKNIFSVDNDGYLYARNSGTTVIKYYRDGQYASIKISIK